MAKKIDAGVFMLTTDLDEGSPLHVFPENDFTVLKFTKRKIEKAPKGYYVKIEHTWKNGRSRAEYFSFDNFKEKYLQQHLPIFLERGARLSFSLGLYESNSFVPLSNNSIFNFAPNGSSTAQCAAFKDFKVKLYYDLYRL